MKLVYFVHKKEGKGMGNCNAIIGKEDGPFHTIHIKSKQKDKKTIEFKPAFSGYELGMIKKPLFDKYLSGKYLDFITKKETPND